MPILVITIAVNGECHDALIVCTPEEYKEYQKTKIMSGKYIQLEALEEFLISKGFTLINSFDVSEGLATMGFKHMFETVNPRFITLEMAKSILLEKNLSFEDFKKFYSEFLDF